MGPSGSSVQGDLFMAGGKDPATGQPVQRAELRHNFVWHPQGTTPQPRIGVAGAPVFFEPCLVGGVDDEGVPVEPYALRFETDLSRWTTVRTPPIDVPVRGHQVEFWTTDAFLIVGGRRADGSLSRDVLRVTVPRPGAPPG